MMEKKLEGSKPACADTPMFHIFKAANVAKIENSKVCIINTNVMKYPIMSHLLWNLKNFSAETTKFLSPVIVLVKFYWQITKRI